MQRNPGISRTEEQIGRLLVEGGFIVQENLDDGIRTVRTDGITLRDALVSKGYIAEETYSTFLSIQTRVPLVNLQQVVVSEDAVRLVPEDVARHYNVLPLMVEGDALRVAMDDPQDIDAINTLTTVTGYRIRARLPTHGSVKSLLGQYYSSEPQMVQQLESILGGTGEPVAQGQQPQPSPAPAMVAAPSPTAPLIPEEVSRAPVVQALDMIVSQAVRDRASDIHIEPTEENVRIRYRIDGVLHQAASLPQGVHAALVSRVKVLAKMDIAERRKPQDGHFSLNVGGEDVDFLGGVPGDSPRREGSDANPEQEQLYFLPGGPEFSARYPSDVQPVAGLPLWHDPGERAHGLRQNHQPLCLYAATGRHQPKHNDHRRPY